MRRDTKKFLFIGLQEEKDTFFEKAQEAGIIHFVDMHTKGVHEVSSDIDTITNAIKVLRGLAPVEQEETEEYILADGIAYKIVQLHHQLEHLREEERIIKLEIARIHIFGDFSIDDIHYIEKEGKCKIQFFCAKPGAKPEAENLIYIDTDTGLDYYAAINDQARQYQNMIEMIIDKPLGTLLARKKEIAQEIHQIEERIKTYAKYNRFLHKALIFKLDKYHLKLNQKYPQKFTEADLFAVEAWVPVTKLNQMHNLVNEMHVFVDEIALDEKDIAPTCLENTGFHRVGEDLVHIYDTPSNTDKDPSLWVLIWFSFFFAMIIGDAGYGLIFLGTALFLHYKYGPFKGVGLRVWKLLTILATTTIIWGFLTNSFFGIPLTPHHTFREYSFLNWMSKKKG